MKKYLGIEFGSTRIKGVLIDAAGNIIASGAFNWENQLVDGVWSYSLDLAKVGLRTCYKELKAEYEAKFNEPLRHIDAIGISGMMHGFLALDKNDNQLSNFRTWRNTITEQAATILTEKFGFAVPQRWSVAHAYQAILNKEKEVKDIAFMSTLAGYFHYLLTGEKVVGVGEASGMFPIDIETKDYNQRMVHVFNELVENDVPWHIEDIFPKVLVAGQEAGRLTEKGRDLIDESKELEIGIPLCPPEGDMGTGMICTNSLRPGTGNASIGTSSNVTLITDHNIGVYKEIDVITTPSGNLAALVHVNNGTSEINAWERLFKETVAQFKPDVTDGDIYPMMFNIALKGDKGCTGLYPVDFLSGEPVAHVNEGKLLYMREPDAKMDLANFCRSHIYSLLGAIRLGVDILTEGENVRLTKVVGHGGFFKTPRVGELMLSAALNVPVLTLSSAGEGGPYGQALLAAYLVEKKPGESIEDYLDSRIFASQSSNEEMASPEDVEGFNRFMEGYKKALKIEKEAIRVFKVEPESGYKDIKQRVYEANMRLLEENLITLTWGNASEIDRSRAIVAIKPSGVPYEMLKPEDIVVIDLEGNVVEGKYKPSSDTPTHLELYRKFPHIGGVVHTHSTYAVAFAQAKKPIKSLGTTHADTFYHEVPVTRDLKKDEIDNDYELNTGKVIAETFAARDYEATPGVLVAGHGPFVWGKDAKEAVDHAVILEKVAQMALLTYRINPDAPDIDPELESKHYQRKHGKNAYYGQKEKNQ